MNKKIKLAYNSQKGNARRRNVAWQFTFEDWWLKWEQSGKWDMRGSTHAKPYQMCRTNDTGPYSFDNTRIDTLWSNINEKDQSKRKRPTKLRTYPPRRIKPKSTRGKGRPQGTGIPVTINGVTYSNRQAAATALKITRTCLFYRLKVGYYK
jgi:hypothetical protein